MKIRLHEVEFGIADVQRSKTFYESIFGLKSVVAIDGLSVFNDNTEGLDSNTSNHLPQGITVISFDTVMTSAKRLVT